jgi:hypothetical protein
MRSVPRDPATSPGLIPPHVELIGVVSIEIRANKQPWFSIQRVWRAQPGLRVETIARHVGILVRDLERMRQFVLGSNS